MNIEVNDLTKIQKITDLPYITAAANLILDLEEDARQVILFGSVARGDYTEKSDVDLAITYGPETNISLNRIRQIGLALNKAGYPTGHELGEIDITPLYENAIEPKAKAELLKNLYIEGFVIAER